MDHLEGVLHCVVVVRRALGATSAATTDLALAPRQTPSAGGIGGRTCRSVATGGHGGRRFGRQIDSWRCIRHVAGGIPGHALSLV